MAPTTKKPRLLFSAFPLEGHTFPLLCAAGYLVNQGYEVVFVAGKQFEERIVAIGAEWLPLAGPDENTPLTTQFQEVLAMPIDIIRNGLLLTLVFYNTLLYRVNSMVAAMETVKKRDPEREIILVEDIINMTLQPFAYGRPLPEGYTSMPKTVGISPTALVHESVDIGPTGLGLLPDSSEGGRERNKHLSYLLRRGAQPFFASWKQAITDCGGTQEPTGHPMTAWFTSYDRVIMLCSPGCEFQTSDIPPAVRFAGCLPRRDIGPNRVNPPWWPELLANAALGDARKKVIFATQGTWNKDLSQMLYPVFEAVGGRDDCILIATLGATGDKLSDDVKVPANTWITDYISYDVILEYTDVFIANGGYGAFSHAVMNGVPAVFAGLADDKLEVCRRAEYAGFAYNIRTQLPTAEMIRVGVDEVLSNPKYKQRAVELRKENEEMDCLSSIQKIIEDISK
ncbi:hypothetical protein VHEMI07031 [[Torrubiella] hemipterigena]|uniref:Erythromycin biosynthesis protein CIII-like C-terminal domain-containing protein n=1 Tax=[Torrubiella] hemipterigena TaxID=1531966 RepID=A0A0A1TKJ3_9HYPO|nr:hypothetical protein VHEMI07031 [[Torrubiella] hemipterigena]